MGRQRESERRERMWEDRVREREKVREKEREIDEVGRRAQRETW